jgi:uncharacterized protein (TIGR02588 family)
MTQDRGGDAGRVQERWLERLIFSLSLALVVGVLVALVALDPPWGETKLAVVPQVTSLDVQETRGALVVRYELENRGTTSVVEVQVEVTAGDQKVDQLIAYLPHGAKHEGVAVLYGLPPGTKPELRVMGYQMP